MYNYMVFFILGVSIVSLGSKVTYTGERVNYPMALMSEQA